MGQSQSDETPKPGDLIVIIRVGYLHWAVYVGDDNVVHVTSPPGVSVESSCSLSSAPNKKAMVRRQKLLEAAGNSTWRICNMLDSMYEPRSPRIIVDEALGQVDNKMEYSVTRKNCEHFATKMRYGRAVSIQGIVADIVSDYLFGRSRPPLETAVEAVLELLRPPTD